MLENALHHACADAELPADLEDAVSARPEFENSQIVVTFTTTTLVAAVAPTVTAVALVCSVLEIVTEVPPSRLPMPDMRVTVTWVYSVLATLVPPCVVANTFAVPALPAGVLAVILVAFTSTTLIAAVPPTAPR